MFNNFILAMITLLLIGTMSLLDRSINLNQSLLTSIRSEGDIIVGGSTYRCVRANGLEEGK